MLKRQKLILALLEAGEKPLTQTILVKLAFLMRQHPALRDDSTFYDFVPYRFGPFSFALYRELSALQRDSYIDRDEKEIGLNRKTRSLTTQAISDLPSKDSDVVRSVVRRYGRLAQDALIRRVYNEYPWYAVRSELSHLVPKDVPQVGPAPIAVYTVGYEGKSIDAFFDGLLRSGVRALLDVRANPVSRKYGFAGRSLREISGKLALEYSHLPELGIDGANRTALTSFAAYQKLLDRYESQMLPQLTTSVHRLLELIRERPSALMCVERDIRCCHRGRLAAVAAEATGLPVVHL